MSWRHVFLTGATGYFGAHLLAALLRNGTGHVTCLVRKGGRERLVSALEQNGLWEAGFADRFSSVPGDLEQTGLGLGAKFSTVARSCDAVIHNGAQVNYVLGLKQLRAANVTSTQEAIRMAEASDADFIFVSTLRLFDHRLDGTPVRENDTVEPAQAMTYGYAHSKMLSERLVAAAAHRGLRTAIFRPGLMCGDGLVGASNPQDAVTLLISACARLGQAPESPLQVNSTSVAYAARGLVALAVKEPGAIWHLVHDTPTRMNDVLALLPDIGFPVQLVPYDQWVSHLKSAPQETGLAPLAEYFTPEFPEQSTRRVFDSSRTTAALAKCDVSHPLIDAAFWRANLRGMAAQGLLGQPVSGHGGL